MIRKAAEEVEKYSPSSVKSFNQDRGIERNWERSKYVYRILDDIKDCRRNRR